MKQKSCFAKLRFLNDSSSAPADYRRTILLIGLLLSGLLLPNLAAAAPCNGFPITLSTQIEVNTFQDVYGPCDTVADNLEIQGNSITDLSPLSGLVTINGYLSFQNLTLLTSLAGLHNLTSIGVRLSIENNSQLSSLAGLSGITTLGSLSINNNSALDNLVGLPAAIASIKFIIISDNANMTSLAGMPTVAQVTETISINGNASLIDVTGLSELTTADASLHMVNIVIQDNDSLQSLDGFPSVSRLSTLRVIDNDMLTNLSAAENLVEVWSFINISENPLLSDCSALETVLDEVDDGDPGPRSLPDPPDSPGLDEILIFGNLQGCNDIAQIVGSGPMPIIFLNGFEGGG